MGIRYLDIFEDLDLRAHTIKRERAGENDSDRERERQFFLYEQAGATFLLTH